MSVLSHKQKRILAQLARTAWEALPREARLVAAHDAADERHPFPSDNQAFTWWRRQEQHKATGALSLTHLRQEDYLVVKLHFETIARCGQEVPTDIAPDRPMARTLAKLVGDDWRRARWHLDKALAERNLDEGYAAAICRRQYRVELGQANTKQLWRLIYTIRNRRKPVRQLDQDCPF